MAEVQAGGSGNTGQATVGEDTRKLSKSEAGYREDQGITGLRCGDCIFFEAGACQIVEGPIDEDDVCDQFEPNLKDGGMQAEQAVERSVRATDMWITRVSKNKKTGKRRWYATSSGVKRDLYNERMSVDLFDDFIKRIDGGEEPPPMFTSDAWSGGMPYLGVAHYLDLNGDGIVGPTLQVWRDGNVLKAKGEFQETPLADAAFKSIQQDQIENRADNERVRISIAFIDWGHNHGKGKEFTRKSLSDTCMYCEAGVGDKEYTAGHLVHLALTRRPAYPETEIVALEEKSMSKRRDDAASIVGEEMADELEKRMKESLVGRTDGDGKVATGAIVVKDEGGQKESEAEVEHALGGARTLDEAEAFLTKSETVLLNSWGVLEQVLSNIVGDEEKALAVRAVLRDFQNTLDVRAAEAVLNVERALGGDLVAKETTDAVERQVPPQFREDEEEERKKKRQPEEEMDEEEGGDGGDMEEDVEAEDEEYEDEEEEEKKKMKEKSTASEHPLDAVFASVREAFDEAMATPGDETMKLRMIQDSYTELGEAIKSGLTPKSTSAPVDEARIERAVNEAVAPLQATLAAIQAQLESGAPVKRSQESIPPRRAIRMPTASRPVVVERSVQQSPTEDNPTPKLRNLIRKSTVGFEQRKRGY